MTVTLTAGLLAAALLVGPLATGRADAAPNPSSKRVEVIVRKAQGSGRAAEHAVRAAGGTITSRLGIIDGFSARIPASALPDLASAHGVVAVTPNGRVEMTDDDDDRRDRDDDDDRRDRDDDDDRRDRDDDDDDDYDDDDGDDYDDDDNSGSGSGGRGTLYRTALSVGAPELWHRGFTGEGVDIALIDTGVAPVEGLNAADKVVYGPDLSFESQDPELRHLDTYGHGTHMAGIIAGRDAGIPDDELPFAFDKVVGVAPGARLVSVKVGNAEGATDVSQVIAAIDWVVKHRNDDGLNIRVLNLSFGTDGAQSYVLDPLSYAADVAWRKGIVVVVAAGNRGFGTKALNNPALNPRVIAVGSVDSRGTYGSRDDDVSNFSSVGTAARRVDVVAPGRSIMSLRVPGSYCDVEYPSARVGSRLFKGSGTSQSAAVVSGAVALLLDQRPSLTPDQVKELLMSSARDLRKTDRARQGAGLVDLIKARRASTPSQMLSRQELVPATGLGTLDGARGSNRLVSDDVVLSGQQDIFGNEWRAHSIATAMLNELNWVGGVFNGLAWTGDGWDGATWEAITWTKNSWSGESWTKNSWSKNSWSADGWTGDGWVKNSWSGDDWTKNSWSSYDKNSWSSAAWR